MRIEVLGTGCRKCDNTATAIREVARELGIEAEVEKVTDPSLIMQYQVMSTPAVAVDGKVQHSGSVPTKEAITSMLGG
ncbi:small redox-active disulfide protein 2 [Halospina denitrificans]|uniref:Small redox-active disulfide protein 2 n=1 Tax=Halospina denitrificans TaxID=332522 RepID=A0A4V3ER96_9GAMM|nr:thioredoxin family protein [Halospina denitrificans]TDT44278.1 small redox-active disulfide protein 2 [Halospina denitrificans]